MTQVYRVELTEGARADVAEIYAGMAPNELAGLGGPVRQRHIGAYRAVYRASPRGVSILFVAHLRQSLQGLVVRRAVRP